MVAIVISILAFGLTLVTFFRNRWKDKRDLFLRMHEALVQPDLVAGRRLLYEIKDERDLAGLTDEDLTRVYRALALVRRARDVRGVQVGR